MVPETLPGNQEKKFIFPFTSHCLDIHQRLNEPFCFVLSMMYNFIHCLSLSVVVFWTTLKSLVWEVLGSESGLAWVHKLLTPSCIPSSS